MAVLHQDDTATEAVDSPPRKVRMTSSVYRRVGIASAIMMASIFLSRVVGLLREMVIAYTGGVGREVDAYQVAFVLPEILNHIAASGFLSVTFIPIFADYIAEGKEEEGWRAFSAILTVFGLLLVVLIAVAEIAAGRMVGWVAPGLGDPATVADAVRMTRIILPAQFFFFSGGLLMAVQFAREKFAVPALAPLLYNGGIIVGGLLLSGRLGMEGFAWGVLAGAIVGNFFLQYRGAKGVGLRYRFSLDFRHPALRTYIRLTLPLMVGLTMMFSTEFFFKFFGSYLPHGGISALNYGLRVMLALVAFFGQAVGVASFPFLARMAAENRIGELSQLLDDTLRYLSLVVPCSVLLIVLRHEVVSILFQRGRFDAAAAELTARILPYLLAGAFAFAAQTLVARGYYAVKDTFFPALYGTLAVLVSLPAYRVCLRLLGIEGVALAVSLSAALQVVVLYALWNRRVGNRHAGRVYAAFGRQALLAFPLGGLVYWIKVWLFGSFEPLGLGGSLLAVFVVSTLFCSGIVAIGYRLGLEEVVETVKRVRSRMRRRKSGAGSG